MSEKTQKRENMKSNSIHLRLLTHTIVLFSLAQILALIVADRIRTLNEMSVTLTGGISLSMFLAYFAIGTILVLLLIKLYHGQALYRILFFLGLCSGLVTVFQMVFPLPISLFVSITFCVGLALLPIIWVHNIAIIISSAGIGALLGMQISWTVAAWLLLILSAYDVVAVYVTGHMVHMARAFIARQASFALIIPESWYGLYEQLGDVRPSGGFLVLGGGDLILPMFLSVAIAPINSNASIGVIVGSLVGLLLNHIVLMRWQRPIPALPMIAVGCLFGFLVGLGM